MPPPSALSNSQESSATINSARSFPSNAYAPATIDEHTPPSSASQRQSGPSDALSGPISSHDTSRHVPQNDEYQVRARQDERQSTTSSSSSRLSGSPTHGSKRTASGAVKRRTPVGAYPQSPEADRRAIHSRNISTDTTSSSIGEVRYPKLRLQAVLIQLPAISTTKITPLARHEKSAKRAITITAHITHLSNKHNIQRRQNLPSTTPSNIKHNRPPKNTIPSPPSPQHTPNRPLLRIPHLHAPIRKLRARPTNARPSPSARPKSKLTTMSPPTQRHITSSTTPDLTTERSV